jgi:hypothetical protein
MILIGVSRKGIMPKYFAAFAYPLSLKQFKLLNIISFKLLWFILVVFQDNAAVPAIIVLIVLNLWHPNKDEAWKSLFVIAFTGIAIDSILSLSGVFNFANPFLLLPIPLWLILLWLAFAMTLPYGFSFIKKYTITVQAIIGGLASFSYLIGRNLDAVSYSYSSIATQFFLIVMWGFLVPLYFILEKRRASNNALLF